MYLLVGALCGYTRYNDCTESVLSHVISVHSIIPATMRFHILFVLFMTVLCTHATSPRFNQQLRRWMVDWPVDVVNPGTLEVGLHIIRRDVPTPPPKFPVHCARCCDLTFSTPTGRPHGLSLPSWIHCLLHSGDHQCRGPHIPCHNPVPRD